MKTVIIRSPEQLSDIVRAERKARKLTQANLADRLGISTQSYSVLERQLSRASFERVHRLCLLLRLDLVVQARGENSMPSTRVEW